MGFFCRQEAGEVRRSGMRINDPMRARMQAFARELQEELGPLAV